MVTNAPWYIPNHVLHTDLQIPTIRKEITWLSSSYKAKIGKEEKEKGRK